MSPRTFEQIRTTVTLSAEPPTFGVLVSNRGGVESGASRTDAVKREIARASRGLYPQIMPVKQMVLSCDREAARRGVSALLKGASGSVRNEIETLARKIYLAV